MVLTDNQKQLVRKHAEWLIKDTQRANKLYNRTIDIASRHEPCGQSAERWLLYLTNNVFIHYMTESALG